MASKLSKSLYPSEKINNQWLYSINFVFKISDYKFFFYGVPNFKDFCDYFHLFIWYFSYSNAMLCVYRTFHRLIRNVALAISKFYLINFINIIMSCNWFPTARCFLLMDFRLILSHLPLQNAITLKTIV